MDNIQDNINRLMQDFAWLKAHKYIKTQEDLANLIGGNRTTISRAMKGDPKYLTDKLLDRVSDIVKECMHQAGTPQKSINVVASPNAQVSNCNNDNTALEEQDNIHTPQLPTRYAPTIPIKAYRAVNFDVMEYFRTTSEYIHLTPVIAQFPTTDCYYFVNSNDMSPNLMTNDLLCLTRLPDDARVTNGDLCIINTKYQGMLERFVYDEEDHLLLKSTQPRWTDMRIPKKEVYSIFRILGGIRTNI